jgi:hypothetical protein
MATAVFCIVDDYMHAERIVGLLKAAGFSPNDISALLPDKRGTRTSRTSSTRRPPKARPPGSAPAA